MCIRDRLDTRDFTAESNLQTVGITDNYEEAKLDIDASEIKVYDGITGKAVSYTHLDVYKRQRSNCRNN